MGDKNEITSKSLLCILANCNLIFRFQIQLVLRALVSEDFLCLQQCYTWNLLDNRHICLKQIQFISIVLFEIFHNITQHSSFHRHNIVHAVNIAHFKVKANILVDVTRGRMLFGTIYRCNFENTIEKCNCSLLIELRRLVQECRLIEIFQMEDIRTALSALCNDFRRMDFRKAFLQHKFTESAYNALLHLKDSTLIYVTKCN